MDSEVLFVPSGELGELEATQDHSHVHSHDHDARADQVHHVHEQASHVNQTHHHHDIDQSRINPGLTELTSPGPRQIDTELLPGEYSQLDLY